MFKVYTLYLKTHRGTGLKYLGVTSRNPLTYKGSGTYWRNHISKHGNDVSTEILYETESRIELTFWALEFSYSLQVTTSEEYANLKDETGYSAYISKPPSVAQTIARRNNILKAIEQQTGVKRDEQFCEAVSTAVKKSWEKRRSNGKSTWKHSQKSKDNFTRGAESRWSSAEQRKLQSDRIKAQWVIRKGGY